jgi:hypothetical protein
MATTAEHDARVAKLTFASVYPHYVTKIEKKGRTLAELHEVISWLTGFDQAAILKYAETDKTWAVLC